MSNEKEKILNFLKEKRPKIDSFIFNNQAFNLSDWILNIEEYASLKTADLQKQLSEKEKEIEELNSELFNINTGYEGCKIQLSESQSKANKLAEALELVFDYKNDAFEVGRISEEALSEFKGKETEG